MGCKLFPSADYDTQFLPGQAESTSGGMHAMIVHVNHLLCMQEKLKPFLVAAGIAALLAALAEACLLLSSQP